MQDIGEGVGRPLLDAFAADFRCGGNGCVNVWWKAQHQIFRIGLLRGAIQLFARFEIVLHRFLKSRTQLGNRFAVKSYDIIDARNVTDKATIFIAVFNVSRITPCMSWCPWCPSRLLEKTSGIAHLVLFR